MMNSRKTVIVFLMFLTIIAYVHAQSGQTGGIKGTLSFQDGSVIPGVLVTLSSPALVIGQMQKVSNENGMFYFSQLPPGVYELTFESDFTTKVIRKGVVVNANVTVAMNMDLKMKELNEIVFVEGKAPSIDMQSVSKTSTISLELLKSLPAQRDLASFMNMTPGVVGSQNAISAGGSSVRDNSYNLDGVQNNDPVVGNSGAAFSMDIVEEVSVQSGGLGANVGSGTGVMVNVITKSGSNSLSGSLSGYLNHESFQSDNTKGTPLEGSKSGSKYDFEPGFTLGGAFIKNKLWFFMNTSLTQSASYVPGFPYDKPEGQETAIVDRSIFPYLKLTFQPEQNSKFILSGQYTKRHKNYDGSRYDNLETAASFDRPEILLSAHYMRNFSNNFMASLKVGLFHLQMNWVPQNTNAGL
jgi:outer membrane receptor protein involved in Fe transport